MPHALLLCRLALALPLAAAHAAQVPKRADRPFVPTSAYESRTVEGWTVRVNRQLLPGGRDEARGAEALRLLEMKLYEVARLVPAAAVARLREVPIWLGVDDGHAPCAEYHPSRHWLEENGYNPDKARGVELGCAEKFLNWSRDQPMMVLHELAHAYHHQVLGHDHAPILAAYEQAVASGRYDSVLHAGGQSRRAYALNNPQEFFAEASEAYFGANDFAPFVRAELKRDDPKTFEAVEAAWRSTPPPR